MSAFLADFGLAKSVATGSKLTRTGEALGTPAYMSPEQARGEVSSLTPATDVWSLGCVLYEMLAGRRPFEGETDAALMGQVLLRKPPGLRALRQDVPPGAERLVRAALAKRVADRYPHAGTMRDDLDRALRGERPRASPPGARRRWVAALGAAGGLALLAAAVGARGGGAGPGALAARPASQGRGRVEALAAQAAGLRSADPRRAAALLGEALGLGTDRHDLRLERGLLLWAVGEAESARGEWARVAREEPGALASRARLFLGLEAFFRLEGGRLKASEARPYLEPLREASGEEGMVARAALHAMRGDWAGARQALREAQGWEAALLQACVESSDPVGDLASAVSCYTAALERGIPFAWAHSNRGLARQSSGNTAGAIADFDAALALDPRLREARVMRGDAKWRSGDLPGAMADFDAALASDPRLPNALHGRGLVKRESGDLRGAIAEFDAALALDPRHKDALNNRGVAKQGLGDPAAAIADYDAALVIDPRCKEALNNRGAAKKEAGDLAGSAADFDAALALDPRYAEAFVNRADAKLAAGNIPGAIADYDAALAVAPRNKGALIHRGNARAASGDFAGAHRDFHDAVALDPRSPDAVAGRGQASLRLGDAAAAIADLEHALKIALPGWQNRRIAERTLARAREALAARGNSR